MIRVTPYNTNSASLRAEQLEQVDTLMAYAREIMHLPANVWHFLKEDARPRLLGGGVLTLPMPVGVASARQLRADRPALDVSASGGRGRRRRGRRGAGRAVIRFLRFAAAQLLFMGTFVLWGAIVIGTGWLVLRQFDKDSWLGLALAFGVVILGTILMMWTLSETERGQRFSRWLMRLSQSPSQREAEQPLSEWKPRT
jgi:hypothetical protein